MLLSYSIKNWKSIKEKSTIDLRAKSIKDLSENKYHLLDNKILPISVIYGPNGGGKSAVINSIWNLITIICNTQVLEFSNSPFIYVLNSSKNVNCINEPIEWEIQFINSEETIFKYQLSINIFENFNFEFTHEYFSIIEKNKKEKLIFESNKDKLNFSDDLEQIMKNLKNINRKIPLISFMNNFFQIKEIIQLFDFFRNIRVFDKSAVLSEDYFNPFIKKSVFFNHYVINKEHVKFLNENKKEFLSIFKHLDLNIVDFIIEERKLNEYVASEYVIIIEKQSEFGQLRRIPFELESCGTREIFLLVLIFLENIKKDALFIIDELDSHLHTKILRYIIKWFTNQQNTNAQLIYTSHDMPTLDNTLFRRDEIYFAAINESYFTDLVSLYDFGDSVRNTQSYQKIYLDGKIGFDPYIEYSFNDFYEKK